MTRKVSIAAILLLALITIGYIAWSEMFGSQTWRYKVTINVETPEGVKTGSAIREVTIGTMTGRRGPESGRPVEPRGEAVVVDLGQRGVLFGLMDFDDYQTMFKAFPNQFVKPKPSQEKVTLKIEDYPKLVAFKNIEDPKSVTEILVVKSDGKNPPVHRIEEDNFESFFGRGVSLNSIEIEMTNEPITWNVDQWLPWLNNLSGGYLHGGNTSKGSPLGLHGGNFKSGGYKK